MPVSKCKSARTGWRRQSGIYMSCKFSVPSWASYLLNSEDAIQLFKTLGF